MIKKFYFYPTKNQAYRDYYEYFKTALKNVGCEEVEKEIERRETENQNNQNI